MKHLKVRARLKPNRSEFDLEIVEQTHLYDNFGGEQGLLCNGWSEYSKWVFIYGDIALGSNVDPVIIDDDYDLGNWGLKSHNVTALVCLLGEDRKSKVLHDVPVSLWPKIKEAVEAYNEFYK